MSGGPDQPAPAWNRSSGAIAEAGDRLHVTAQKTAFSSTRKQRLGDSPEKSQVEVVGLWGHQFPPNSVLLLSMGPSWTLKTVWLGKHESDLCVGLWTLGKYCCLTAYHLLK